MLVELGRAMLAGGEMPEFLWEQAILHVAYIRNRSYAHHTGTTPYEKWIGEQPNIGNLGEFGAPVWILSQGQCEE